MRGFESHSRKFNVRFVLNFYKIELYSIGKNELKYEYITTTPGA